MKKYAMVVLSVALLAGVLQATPMLSRGASVLRPLHFIGYAAIGYSRTTSSYDWTNNGYEGLADSLKTGSVSAQVMAGMSPLSNLEVLLMAPVVFKDKGDLSSAGLGDAWLLARYGLLNSGLLPVRLTLAAALALPTSAQDAAVKLADHTTDIGLGLAAQTVKIGPLAGHFRAAYWFKGKSNDTTRLGNVFEYVVFPDFSLGKKASFFVTLSGTVKANQVINGESKLNTESLAQYVGAGFTWNPIGPLWLKPKAALPVTALSKGGSLPGFSAGLDVWATLP